MKSIVKFIGLIFKGIWVTLNFIRRFVISILVLIGLLSLLIGIFYQQGKPEQQLIKPTALTLDLQGTLVEQTQLMSNVSQITRQVIGTPINDEIDLHQLVDTIHQAKDDPKITGIILKLDQLSPSGLTKLHTVGEALADFKTSGKPVIATADNYSQGQYYLASYASQIILNPAGSVLIKGLSANQLFYKDALDKLGITSHIFRVGIYKSFVEPYQRNQMSEPARQDLSRWVHQIWQDYVNDVAHNRGIAPSDVAPSGSVLLQRLTAVDGNAAQYAFKNKFVDHLLNRQQTKIYLAHAFHQSAKAEDPYIDLRDYQAIQSARLPIHSNRPQIAIVTAQGPIVSGQTSNRHVIASENMLEQLDQVLNNPSIKGMVLRVDSPGGSAFAAEIIRSKLEEIQKAGKPVVVSMGATAASGGYWISATSDHIFAQPTTITGSIGIFGMFATAENGLDKLGIHADGIATTDYATISPLTALPDDVAKILQLNVESGYHQFIALVQKGRHYPNFAAVDQLAQGRIWTGREAKANGLVDELGGLNAAVAYTAKQLKLTDYDQIRIHAPETSTEQWLGSLLDSQFGQWLDSKLPAFIALRSVQQAFPNQLWESDPQHRFVYCSLCRAWQ
ncbi:signal peptide peptidase SppA [Celerinatantimonas sp. YJH-8]|uniref:signal peptide peptidase SppA n=1 Tax=Celerinatantimonas sp. YJH-8 TaxID=3228714 RepID=UPI0038C62885